MSLGTNLHGKAVAVRSTCSARRRFSFSQPRRTSCQIFSHRRMIFNAVEIRCSLELPRGVVPLCALCNIQLKVSRLHSNVQKLCVPWSPIPCSRDRSRLLLLPGIPRHHTCHLCRLSYVAHCSQVQRYFFFLRSWSRLELFAAWNMQRGKCYYVDVGKWINFYCSLSGMIYIINLQSALLS